MNRKSILLALVAAVSITGVADAQSKYYMRSRIAPNIAAKASTPTCGALVVDTWVAQKQGKPAASVVTSTTGHTTPEAALDWCNKQNPTAENMCLWQRNGQTIVAINAVPTSYPNVGVWASTCS
jgi:hypothetical protein